MKAAVALVAHIMRDPDTLGRLDQERLTVLLPETPAAGAVAFMRRVRRAAGPELAALRGSYATFPQDGRTWDDLVAVALSRLAAPDAPALPETPTRIGLRGAFPSFKSVSDRPIERSV